MPIYEYKADSDEHSCSYCRDGFDIIQKISDAPLKECPKCGNAVSKQLSAPSVGASRSGLDDRAKNAGFHKLKKLGKGEYEKEY
jgi:putative FmdB family regulatory protein